MPTFTSCNIQAYRRIVMRNKQIGVMHNIISHHKYKNRALNKFEKNNKINSV